ncbi:uncharacterized protein LOC6527488 [Drosophila yakuba]|uniref:Protein TsetseEP domain-containing protein n=1 Tax=Drosophila yakuba TaxID=7245 RepID=B4P348_DROYA|nr:uncharacterized protein LOC6527488 [Drosophila yakuba]EDW88290.1 uncharacterized protein Dyak_GE18645 [Drosophila yakuba]
MHSTKSAVFLLALAISASCVVATPHLEILNDVFEAFNTTGQQIISGLVDATKNGTAIAGEFLDSIRNSSAQYTHETVEFAHKIADAVHRAATEGISDFSEALRAAIDRLHQEIDRVRNILQRQTLKNALAKLQTINAAVTDLEIAVNNLNDRIDEKKEQYSLIIQEKWSQWGDAQLKRVDEQTNGVGNEEAEEILDELVSRYSAYLHSCLEELQAQQASYEQNVHEAVVKYHNATNNLAAQIELCAESNLNFLSCSYGINRALRGLASAPADLISLKLQGIRLLAIGLNASGCVGQTLAQYELEKPSVERELDEIIRSYQEQNSSTDDDSNSDNETTTVSEESS